MVRRGVRRDKEEKEQNQERFMGLERSQEGQGRNGTGSDEATVVRRGVRRDKEVKEQDQMRPPWSGEESGGTRKEWYRIR